MNKVLAVSAFLWVVASTDPLLLKLNPTDDGKKKATQKDDKNNATAVQKKLFGLNLNLTVLSALLSSPRR